MKKIELNGSVSVYYGTLEEIKKAAQEQGIILPKEMKEYVINVNGDDILVFVPEINEEDDKRRIIKKIETSILKYSFFQVSGEEISANDCQKYAYDFMTSMDILEREIYEERTWKK